MDNQCNDKWDNLLRDYKKVLDYELQSSQSQLDGSDLLQSYWIIDKQERKNRNLPSNMAFQVYQSLKEVVQKKNPQRPITLQEATVTPRVVQPAPPPEAPPSAVAQPAVSGK
ncbi:unnamed protein product [Ilex paraguariensis]|uniref:Uncharacterized protein n=1 Tax=Ilex paraguariensis TaxID=185542 RepID=A0ABC8R9R9_9AQUA